jgi:hypothetical protein
MVFSWADEIIRCPAMLDAVETLLGPDLMVREQGGTRGGGQVA